ncbi:hypothetical protein ACHAXR_003657 [Thalassiosira sp. AJA248-18]
MRLLRIATAFITASSSSRASLAFALVPSSSISSGRSLSRPSFISTLFTTIAVSSSSSSSPSTSSFASATATENEEGECTNATLTQKVMYDLKYPGTAVQRLKAVHERVSTIANDGTLNGPWEDVRRRILWAGGLRDLPIANPGQGYTGHSFNDWNHVDLTTMNDDSSDNLNDGSVKGIMVGNKLGPGIRIASLPELGPGGSWSTCAMGCNVDPPNDVAHIQFRSRVAFKLVWVPNAEYDTFVLVDDDGKLLAKGKPSDGPGALPRRREREMNYQIMKGSKYATVVESLASSLSSSMSNSTTIK